MGWQQQKRDRRRELAILRLRVPLHVPLILWLYRVVDYSWHRPTIWRSGAPQEQSCPPLPELDDCRHHHLSMDVLGLLSSLLAHCRAFYRRPLELRYDESPGRAFTWFSCRPRDCVLSVSDAFLRLHGADRHRWLVRTRTYPSVSGLQLLLGHSVYCPIACWTWNSNGWLYNLPSLDFAGGGPVHIASGWAGLAYAFVLGKRKHDGEKSHGKPHNITLVFLGTVLIWFGWFGFNGGSALNATVRAMYAAFDTNTAASTGVIGWVLVDYIKSRGHFSVVGACEGAIAGLVGITPAAGYVSCWPAALIGFLTAVVCASLQDLNEWLRIDEGLYVFKLHGIGGMCGAFLTGIFADSAISALDGSTLAPGAWNGNGIQVGKQFAEITSISAYSFVVTCILLLILKYIPGMHLRVSEEAEMRGLDLDQFFDEAIGESDWGTFMRQEEITYGLPRHEDFAVRSGASTERETVMPEAKESRS